MALNTGNLTAIKGIGQLDQRITLRSYTESQNAFNEIIPSYSDLETVWAMVDYSTGKEEFDSKQETAVQMIHFIIRYRTDVEPKMQIVWDSKTYEIIGQAERIGRERFLKIPAQIRE